MIVLDNYNDYLKGSLSIQLSGNLAPEQIENFINEVEDEMLLKLLGENVYSQVKANTFSITTLINGVGTYQYGGKNYRFDGLKEMIACFVFYKFQNYIRTSNSSNGFLTSKNQNSELIYDADKMRYAYNRGVDLYYSAYDYMSRIETTYDDVVTKPIRKINALYF